MIRQCAVGQRYVVHGYVRDDADATNGFGWLGGHAHGNNLVAVRIFLKRRMMDSGDSISIERELRPGELAGWRECYKFASYPSMVDGGQSHESLKEVTLLGSGALPDRGDQGAPGAVTAQVG